MLCLLRYQLMTLCWSLEPTDRPTFKTIGQLIDRLLPCTVDALLHHRKQVRPLHSPANWAPALSGGA